MDKIIDQAKKKVNQQNSNPYLSYIYNRSNHLEHIDASNSNKEENKLSKTKIKLIKENIKLTKM